MVQTVPEGTVPPPQQPAADQNWLGVTALVTGLCGLNVVALVFGVLGLRANKAGRATNRGMALAGAILGGIGVVIGLGLAIFLLVFVGNQAKSQVDDEAAMEVARVYPAVQAAAAEAAAANPSLLIGANGPTEVRSLGAGQPYMMDFWGAFTIDPAVPIADRAIPGDEWAIINTEVGDRGNVTCISLWYEGGRHDVVYYDATAGVSFDSFVCVR